MEESKLAFYKKVVELESRRYLCDAGLLENRHRHFSMRVARYVLCSYICLPVKTIIIGERPYSTDIHPDVSSAMSYDPEKSRPTPSTTGLARDLSANFGTRYVEIETWFRDSWKYLASGVLMVNCSLFVQFSSSHSLSETVPFQRWMRSILDVSMAMSESKIDVICMGVPSRNVVDSALRSIGVERSRVNKMFCSNPAAIMKSKAGDLASLDRTLGKKSVSKAILAAVKRSRTLIPLVPQDYFSEIRKDMSAQVPQADRLIHAANNIALEMEDAYKELEGNHKLPSVKEAADSFIAAMVEYRDAVLKDLVASSIASIGDNSGKVGKATEWGSKKPWKKTAASVGASSRMSTMPEDTGGVDQSFADDDAQQVTFADETETEKPVPVEAPKKKKMVKKVVRRVKKQPETMSYSTKVGSKLGDSVVSGLKSVSYYMSDKYASMSQSLQNAVVNSINTETATNEDVCLIVDAAARDLADTGAEPSASLGIDDGVVSEVCTLPKVVEKLVATRP